MFSLFKCIVDLKDLCSRVSVIIEIRIDQISFLGLSRRNMDISEGNIQTLSGYLVRTLSPDRDTRKMGKFLGVL